MNGLSLSKSAALKWAILTGLLILMATPLLSLLSGCKMLDDMETLKKPRYEVGSHAGAKFCATCHKAIYDEWSENSRHAVATTNRNFLKTRDDVTGSFMLNLMMGEESCYACHGSKSVNEGVDCETCHGVASPDIPITETHQKKFKPGRAELKAPEFCAKCHELFPPIMSPYSDWKASEAAEKNITCQGCHMAPSKNGTPYHGFDSILHDAGIYEGDIVINEVDFDFPRFSLSIENRITGHGVPAGGPSRVLVLEIRFMDSTEKELHRITEKFYKKFKLMPIIGKMPTDKLILDTQLKSKEVRRLNYKLPASIKKTVSRMIITLSFYDVEDQYQGDIEKAHWVSGPIAKKVIDY